QPPPRPPQSTIPQLTSLLINNAGALGGISNQSRRPITRVAIRRVRRGPRAIPPRADTAGNTRQ
ncbi:hypothetical protein OQ727_09910, partial [Mycobacterium ulcerans]|nr:hypothetical protein [Mycobacterium ulcerans]MEB4043560.1 hypothetical protein [Mycobacterium ulcerans]MEB4068384.1 hypothetical protein [Mycobacterium ulcerans]MEB4122137.1 hypothetical protein [Mycobacterium ulcerans]MEB4167688.1 hypothetical protein [Mycobacterium ulcerans]